MLLNDLYIIQSLTGNNNQILSQVLLNPDHDIFNGHFPGQPVLPGVCMLEMISEIVGEYSHDKNLISGAPMIKFLQLIDPGKNRQIDFEINCVFTPETTIANGKIFFESQIFMKFQLALISLKKIKKD